MKKELAELKESTDKMLRNFSINVFLGERDLIEKIDKLFEQEDADIEDAKKLIKEIEEHLKRKERTLRK